jgi:hypothetical protein
MLKTLTSAIAMVLLVSSFGFAGQASPGTAGVANPQVAPQTQHPQARKHHRGKKHRRHHHRHHANQSNNR